MDKKLITIFVVAIIIVTSLSGCLEEKDTPNKKPVVSINYPLNRSTVSSLVMISGIATDLDGDEYIIKIEVKIGDDKWDKAYGTTQWIYHWNTYDYKDGRYIVSVRSWDGNEYSEVQTITVDVDNPEVIDSDSHKWALFVATANFPEDNESKLGNGGLYLAEDIAEYLIEECDYATSNVIILFDDGWIRDDNGYGEKLMTLQERNHEYDITYGGATKDNVEKSIDRIINQSNNYRNSEVFIWFFNHGYGDLNNSLTGGKLLESSQIFLWDDIFSDKELGELLSPLKSKKVTVIVDACFCGGFADKTIFNIPTVLLFRSGIPRSGRVVIAGASKFRKGYTSTTKGPLFSLLWFEGLTTGDADGFRAGLFKMGKPRKLNFFKDGEVSVEEAFYYARYKLSTDKNLKEFDSMEPQINDRFPYRGLFFSRKGLIL
jgi:hypothetical protein